MIRLTILSALLLAVFGHQIRANVSLPETTEALLQGNDNRQSQVERKAEASKILAKAVQLAEREHHSAIKAELLSSLAIVYVKLGEKEKGDDLLARSRQLIEEEDDLSKDCYECPGKEFFRILLAIDHAQSGQKNRALELLEQIVRNTEKDATSRRGQLLAGLGSVFAGVGSTERALQLLNEASELTKAIEDRTDKAIGLEEIAERYASVDQLERAMSIVALMENGPWKDGALVAIAKKYSEAGQFDRALKIGADIETTNFKPDILTFVAKQYLKRGQKERATVTLRKAVKACEKVTANNLQQFARHDIGLLFAEAGRFDEALQLVKATDAQSPKLRLLSKLAPLFARARRIKVAERLLADAYRLTGFSKGTYFQAGDIREVADGYAAIGNKMRAAELLAQAATVLNALEDPTNKELVFSEIVESYLNLGAGDKALQTAERMEGDSRAELLTLLRIASEFAGAAQLMNEKDKIVEALMRP